MRYLEKLQLLLQVLPLRRKVLTKVPVIDAKIKAGNLLKTFPNSYTGKQRNDIPRGMKL